MITKSIKYLLATILAGTLVSCNEWLKIDPQYEVTDTELFKNTQGYYQAINGLYYGMSTTSLYGQNLSWGVIDAWARYYVMPSDFGMESFYQFYSLQYEEDEAESTASSIWGTGYNVIAQANDIIAHAEAESPEFFTNQETDRNVILGEAYAVRAMMHFDLLRIFGPCMQLDPDGKYIPYVDVYPSTVNPPISSREVINKVINDLKKARDLVGTFDLNSNGMQSTYRFFGSVSESNEFYENRGIRLNYYAITGLLARAYLWAGDKENAFIYADELVQLVKDGTFDLQLSSSIESEPKMMTELLFGFYNEDMVENYEPYANTENTTTLKIDQIRLFYDENNQPIDNRAYFINRNTFFMTKYTTPVSDQKDMVIPNLRLSEMYFIAAECKFNEDKAAAIGYLTDVRTARGNEETLSTTMDESTFISTLIEEYKKDLIGEGQLIFLYKRLNRPIVYSGGEFNHNGNLVVPIPNSESAI